MKDITKESYAEWLEDTIKHLLGFEPTNIAILAMGHGETAASYYNCNASDIAQMAGMMEQDGMFMRIEANTDWLRSLIEEHGGKDDE